MIDLKNRRQIAGNLFVGLAILWLFYDFTNYSGLFRIVSNFQKDQMGSYYPYLSAIPYAAFVGAGLFIAGPSVSANVAPDWDKFDTWEDARLAALAKRVPWLSRLLPLAVMAATAAWAWTFTQPSTLPPPVRIAGAETVRNLPMGTYIELEAAPLPHLAVQLEKASRSGVLVDLFVPAAPAANEPGITFLMHLYPRETESPRAMERWAQSGRIRGTLTGSVDGEALDYLARSNVAVAKPHYVIDIHTTAPRERFMTIAILLSLVAAVLSIIWFRLSREFRRLLAER